MKSKVFSSLFSQEEIEVYSHILAGLKPLVQGKLDAEVAGEGNNQLAEMGG